MQAIYLEVSEIKGSWERSPGTGRVLVSHPRVDADCDPWVGLLSALKRNWLLSRSSRSLREDVTHSPLGQK